MILHNLKISHLKLMACLLALAVNAGAAHGAEDSVEASLYTYRAVVTSVYDGDTVTADIDLGMKIWLRGERLRLWGIDTPELNRGHNRQLARRARDYLRKKILHRQVIIKTIKDRKGKYGRYLAVIYSDGVNINELMVLQSFAKRYMAGKRAGN